MKRKTIKFKKVKNTINRVSSKNKSRIVYNGISSKIQSQPDERKILRELSAFLNTDAENIPNVLNRFKREIHEMEEKLKQ